MLRKTYVITLLLFLCQLTFAQMPVEQDTLYGNEWINYTQPYYKVKVVQDGFYRIDYQTLANAGIFANSNAPEGANFQLFSNGQEIPLYVSTENAFGNSDYIAFYGKANQAWLDQFLYLEPEFQLNPGYSMYTDTATYFLTWTTNVTTKRFLNTENNLDNLPVKENYCWYMSEKVFTERYMQGREVTIEGGSCRYDLGEGYARNTFNNRQNVSLNTPHAYANGPEAEAEFRFYVDRGAHDIYISNQGTTYWNEAFNSWAVRNPSFPITPTLLDDQTTFLLEGQASESDNIRLAQASVRYPRTFDVDNQSTFIFQLEGNGQRQYLEIQNFDTGNSNPVLYDLSNQLRLTTTVEGNLVKAVLPAATGLRELVLINPAAFRQIETVEERTFTPYNFSQGSYDYIILTHPDLYDDGNGNNYIQQYADYRTSVAGGGYQPLIVDVTQLYDQFGYGVYRHEIGIRNFLKLASINWQSEYLYIIGKGVDRHSMRNRTNGSPFDQVPPFGQPHSDYLFVMDNNSTTPWMAVGRIAAYQPEQIRIYLEKVKEFEGALTARNQTIEDRAWMKKVLHFGGGDSRIQNLIQNELNRLKDTLSTSQFGANVVSFFKNSTDVIQSAQSDEVSQQIDEGAALISFFGHSAPNTLDFDIGQPQEYNNQGKYPIFYAIGCNTNRVFDKASTLSEEYVFVENRGAIAFFGATWVTELSNLSAYAKFFYGNLGNDNYGQTLGSIIRSTIEDFSLGSSFISEQLKQVLMLHGDPALRVYPYEAPDYVVNTKKTALSSDVISLQADSVQVDFTITNLGRAVQDSMQVLIEQQLPNGKLVELRRITVATPFYETSYTLTLPLLKEKDVLGKNLLRITVDEDDRIAEQPAAAEQNNVSSIQFFVITNDITLVYPKDFAIVSETTPKLAASTTNAFAEALQYYIEIDTTANFNSPLKRQQTLTQKGGLLEWTPQMSFIENTVYYWRTSVDSTLTDGGGFNWNTASFVYLPEKGTGWNQSHYQQYVANEINRFVQDSTSGRQQFEEATKLMRVANGAYPTLNWGEISLFEDGFRTFTGWPCENYNSFESMLVAVYDPVSLDRQINPFNNRESPNCWQADLDWYIFFLHNQTERGKLIQFLENLEAGKYVAMFTTQRRQDDFDIANWASDSLAYGTNLFKQLEERGAQNIRNLIYNPTPYIFIFQQDNPNFRTVERHAPDANTIIEASAALIGLAEAGSLTSLPLGPAKSWQSLRWQVSEREAHDQVSVDVWGITANEEEVLLHERINAFDTTLAHISAEQYPYLKLRWHSQDTVNRTTAQLDHWRVLYEPYPEAALAPNLHLNFHADTLQQGEPLQLEIAIANVSEVDMDSLLVKYTIVESDNNEIVRLQRLRPLPQQDTLLANMKLDTRTLTGKNRLIIEINPEQDQLEQFDFNNIGIREFFVETDKRNPVLDVTFDGIHILNGDIVSPQPQIIVTLKDENEFLALNDTSLFEVQVRYPSGQIYRFPFDDERVVFYPASEDLEGAENQARIELRPEFFEDGLYELILAAEDRAGNDAGQQRYTVEFEVINKQMISNVFNYPNPFTTSTQFVFTLTGSDLPQDMMIQIMTVSGRVVREVTMAELGPLKIGHNITDFSWDGTDEFGDRLANGVYLYRVITRNSEGQEMEKYDTETDQFFTSGIGKMVLLR